MDRNILNLLGCSGSIALALLSANSATANPADSSYKKRLFPHNRVKCSDRYILPSTGHGLSLEFSS